MLKNFDSNKTETFNCVRKLCKATNFKKFFVFIIFLSLFFNLVNPNNKTFINAQDWKQEYNEHKDILQKDINNLNDEIDALNKNLYVNTERKNSLLEEKNSIQKTIEETNSLINLTQSTIENLGRDIKSKEGEIYALDQKMGDILVDIQAKNKSPVQILFSTQDFAQTISEIASIDSLNEQLKDVKLQVSAAKSDLENSKRNEEAVFQSQQAIQALNKSKKDDLEILIAKTQNDESKYQQLVIQENQKRMALGIELQNIDKKISEKEAEENKRRVEEELKKAEEARLATAALDAEREKEAQKRFVRNDSNTSVQSSKTVLSSNPPSNTVSSNASVTIPIITPNPSSKNEGYPCYIVNEAKNTSGIPGGWGAPATGYITSGFGCGTGWKNSHDGIDIANGMGTPIYSVADGVVVASVFTGNVGWGGVGYANYVVIKHSFGSKNVYSLYAHLEDAPLVKVGETVRKGDRIGSMGSTGNSFGVHLHFALINDTYTSMGGNCDRKYNYNYVAECYNPFDAPFNLY